MCQITEIAFWNRYNRDISFLCTTHKRHTTTQQHNNTTTQQQHNNTRSTHTVHAPHAQHISKKKTPLHLLRKYKPTSFQEARGLHKDTQRQFVLHDARLGRGPCALALRASQCFLYRGLSERVIFVVVIVIEKRKSET